MNTTKVKGLLLMMLFTSILIANFNFFGNVNAQADFSISADPDYLTIAAGTSGTSTINVTSFENFNSPVDLSVLGAPTFVTTGFSDNPVTPPANSWVTSTLTITVGTPAVPGDYTLTVNGTSGTLIHTFDIGLTVTGPDFSISADPTYIKIAAGASGTSTINVTSFENFNSPVTLSVEGAPTEVTTSFSDNPVTPPANGWVTSTLTITASDSTPAGSYTLTVNGTSDILFHTVDITLDVFNTKIFVDPPSIKDYLLVPSVNVTININISNVVGLNFWQFNMTWDNTVLNVTGTNMIQEGPFMKSAYPGKTYFIAKLLPLNEIPQYMVVGCTFKVPVTVDGSGILANVTFQVVGLGKTALHLVPPTPPLTTGTYISDLYGYPIDHTTQDGYLNNLPPPVASFTYTPQRPWPGQIVTFNASNSYKLKGTIVSYRWDFGDGNVTTVSNPVITHSYTDTGKYTVTLEVTDDDGYTSTSTDSVIVSAAPVHDISVIDIKPSPTKVTAGGTVSINVTVSNGGDFHETFNVTAYYDSNAIGTQLVTNLANGTRINLIFNWDTTSVPAGTYTISAQATLESDSFPDDNTKTDGEVTVIKPPIASFVYTPTAPVINQTVTFDASDSLPDGGTIVSYRWDFGDGNVTTVSNPIVTHSYTVAKAYTVTLTVTDSEELTNNATETITVGKIPSTVSINVNPTSASVGSKVTISGAISPLRADVEVTIKYRLESGDWKTLATVLTDSNSNYSYDWLPSNSGTYRIKASWPGDANTLSGESEEKTLTVEAQSNMLLYLVGGIVIVIVVATLIYFVRFRKPK